MPALDRHDVDKAIYNALKNAPPVTIILGSTPRIDFFVPANVAFPFVRVDHIPIGPWTGTMKSGGVDWVERQRYQFNAFSRETSLDEVSQIITAIDNILEQIPSDPNATIAAGSWGSAIKGIAVTDFDPEEQTSYGVLEYTFSFERT